MQDVEEEIAEGGNMKNKQTSDVYFLPWKEYNTNAKLSDALNYVLDYNRLPFCRSFWSKQLVGIKPSCSKKCEQRKTFFSLVQSTGDLLKHREISAFICDTSNRHKKISSNALEQIRESYCEYMDEREQTLPIFMLDGINGSYEYTAKVKGNEVYLGGELPHIDGIIMMTSMCRHPLCGSTGALYNLGAGLASKRGKIKQRTLSKPQVNVEKCYSCKSCLHACPVNAISMKDNHVLIDEDLCVDCGRCVEIAKRCGISYHWDATPEYFQKRMIEYASAAVKILADKAIYINLIPGSDHDPEGILISKNPLAIDQASLDICNKTKTFDKSNKELMKNYIALAKNLEIGESNYQIQEIAY